MKKAKAEKNYVKKQQREEKEQKKFYILHSTKLTRPPKRGGGGEGVGTYFADKCTVQYSRSLFYGQRKLCLALFSFLTLRL
jgi:hypothetical protein